MTITKEQLQASASLVGLTVAHLNTIREVESTGSGFMPDGKRPKVQYEPHIMYRRITAKFGKARADKELAAHPDLVALKAGSYNSLEREDQDMDRAARLIDRDCALESASWGAFQVMGFNWKDMGLASIQKFVNLAYTDAGQLEMLVRFLKANPKILAAAKSLDWTTFARLYNGPAYAANNYDTKLRAAYKKHQ